MAIRPLARSESIPPVAEAPPAVAGKVAAYEAAVDAEDDAGRMYGASSVAYSAWASETDRARTALEDLLLDLALSEGRAWYRVGNLVWGVRKKSKRGLELESRPLGEVLSEASKRASRPTGR